MGGRQKSGKDQPRLQAGGATFGMTPSCALWSRFGAIRKELIWKGLIYKRFRKDRKPIPSSSYPPITFECLWPFLSPSMLAIGIEVSSDRILVCASHNLGCFVSWTMKFRRASSGSLAWQIVAFMESSETMTTCPKAYGL